VLRSCHTNQPGVRRRTQQPRVNTQGRRQHTRGDHVVQNSTETETGFSRCFLQPGTLPSGTLVMATLHSICGHYILKTCGFFFLPSFFLAYSQLLQIGCLPYFHTWCGLRTNLGCRSEMCCTQLVKNTGCKKSPKIRHLHTIAQLYLAIPLQLRHASTIRKETC